MFSLFLSYLIFYLFSFLATLPILSIFWGCFDLSFEFSKSFWYPYSLLYFYFFNLFFYNFPFFRIFYLFLLLDYSCFLYSNLFVFTVPGLNCIFQIYISLFLAIFFYLFLIAMKDSMVFSQQMSILFIYQCLVKILSFSVWAILFYLSSMALVCLGILLY